MKMMEGGTPSMSAMTASPKRSMRDASRTPNTVLAMTSSEMRWKIACRDATSAAPSSHRSVAARISSP